MDLIAAFRMFTRVAAAGSFSSVARELGVTQPAISRQVSALEEHLGVRLVQRTTRSLGLTEDGRDLLGHAQLVIEAVERAEASVGRRHAHPSGQVRLAASTTFGRVVIAPRIHRLLARYPDLSVDLLLSDKSHDLVHDGVDVAVRVGAITEASLIARRIGTVSLLIVASASYLASHPEPQCPEDLGQHECIIFDRNEHPEIWRLSGAEGTKEVRVHGRFRTDSAEATRAAVVTGLGLAIVSGWLLQDEIRSGAVRAVLPSWQPVPIPVYAVYPRQRNLAPRTRATIDFLVEEFKTDPALSDLRNGL